ncbi:hypothetical protein [Legionella sp. W05-934-2]|uniref:hypothetical protein n=1 Tax=Legionella sp. W05-934-2 TaxID=1198649 RepID=UPI0034624D99
MAAILSLLQSLQPSTPQVCDESKPDYWCFKSRLLDKYTPDGQGDEFFRPFIYDYDHLLIIYALNCSLIAKSIQASIKIDKDDHLLESHLKNALALANLLYVINTHYFNSPLESRRLEKEEIILRCLLRSYGYRFELIRDFDMDEDHEEAHKPHEKPISKWFREQTASVNWPRLLIVRVKRVLDALVPIFKGFPGFANAIFFMDSIANPIFAYLAWVFYVPRLSLNLFLLLKNVLPHPWMDKRQRNLGFLLRFKSQLKDKWFELANDSVWLLVGLINCFVLVGSLAPWSMYLTVALYAFDIALAGIRAYIELSRLNQLKQQLIDLAKDTPHSQQLKAYLEELDNNIAHERRRLGLSLVTTTGLFIGMLFALPAFAGTPVIPLTGAVFIVLFCISTFAWGKYIDKHKPCKPLLSLEDAQLVEVFQSNQYQLRRSRSVTFLSHLGNKEGEFDSTMENEQQTALDQANSSSDNVASQPRPRFDIWRFHQANDEKMSKRHSFHGPTHQYV